MKGKRILAQLLNCQDVDFVSIRTSLRSIRDQAHAAMLIADIHRSNSLKELWANMQELADAMRTSVYWIASKIRILTDDLRYILSVMPEACWCLDAMHNHFASMNDLVDLLRPYRIPVKQPYNLAGSLAKHRHEFITYVKSQLGILPITIGDEGTYPILYENMNLSPTEVACHLGRPLLRHQLIVTESEDRMLSLASLWGVPYYAWNMATRLILNDIMPVEQLNPLRKVSWEHVEPISEV